MKIIKNMISLLYYFMDMILGALDTVAVLLVMAYLFVKQRSVKELTIYVIIVLSSIIITKVYDKFLHNKAVLFKSLVHSLKEDIISIVLLTVILCAVLWYFLMYRLSDFHYQKILLLALLSLAVSINGWCYRKLLLSDVVNKTNN